MPIARRDLQELVLPFYFFRPAPIAVITQS
jgi:hypothetical protein